MKTWFSLVQVEQHGIPYIVVETRLYFHIDGLVQERHNSSASAMELHLSCTNPDSKVHEASMGPIWGRQDPGGPHVDRYGYFLTSSFFMREMWIKYANISEGSVNILVSPACCPWLPMTSYYIGVCDHSGNYCRNDLKFGMTMYLYTFLCHKEIN